GLREHSWPGNIRELQSVLRQALLQASGTVLFPAFLPESLGGPGEASPAATGKEPALETFAVRQRLASDVRDLHVEAHRELDRLFFLPVLEYTGGDVQQAALILVIAGRTLAS